MAATNPNRIIAHLTELRDKIKDWESRRVVVKDSIEFEVWQTQVENWMRKGGIERVGTELAYFMNLTFCSPAAQLPGGAVYTDEDQDQYLADLALAREYITSTIETLAEDLPQETARQTRFPGKDSRRVFIIHGHDGENRLRLERLLKERFGLEPVVLAEEPARGRTIIEKLEDEIPTCGFAFALMSPDDNVSVTGQDGNVEEYAQARPNVPFEMGWVCGQLGRERLCILYKRETKIHSDLDGVNRLDFRNNVEEVVLGIERELRAAKLL